MPLSEVHGTYAAATRDIMKLMLTILPAYMRDELEDRNARFSGFTFMGEEEGPLVVSTALARRVAALPLAVDVPDIVDIAKDADCDLKSAADVYYRVTETFKVGMIQDAANRLEPADFYETLALDRALQSLGTARRKICKDVIKRFGSETKPVTQWLADEQDAIGRVQGALSGIVEGGALSDMSVSRLSVVSNFLADLAK